jgi:hypothetical protein
MGNNRTKREEWTGKKKTPNPFLETINNQISIAKAYDKW